MAVHNILKSINYSNKLCQESILKQFFDNFLCDTTTRVTKTDKKITDKQTNN